MNKILATGLILASFLSYTLPQVLSDNIDNFDIADQPNERYDPRLLTVTSLDAAVSQIPSFVTPTGDRQKDIADAIVRFTEKRFVHGESIVSIRDNWILRAFDKVSRVVSGHQNSDFMYAGVLDPNDILQYPKAFCSQQSIVIEALLARYKIHYQSVRYTGFPGHFTVAANTRGIWRYYDADLEPSIQGAPLRTILNGQGIKSVYQGSKVDAWKIQGFMEQAHRGQIKSTGLDSYPASRGLIFSNITAFFSKYLWIMFLIPLLVTARKKFTMS